MCYRSHLHLTFSMCSFSGSKRIYAVLSIFIMILIYTFQQMTGLYVVHKKLQAFSSMNILNNTKHAVQNESEHTQLRVSKYIQFSSVSGNTTAKPDSNNCFYYIDCVNEVNKKCLRKHINILLKPDNLCSNKYQVDTIYILTSHYKHTEHRQAIRESYMKPRNKTAENRHVFLIGFSNDRAVQEALFHENKIHNDIVQGDFIEAYSNLTLKVLMGFHYINVYCSGAKSVMKSDDDVFINIDAINSIVKYINHSRFIAGSCHPKPRIIRKADHRWYVDPRLYSASQFPPYCLGSGYLISQMAMADVLHSSTYVPVIPVEDAYIGICIARLNNSVNVIHLGTYFTWNRSDGSLGFHCTTLSRGSSVTVHGVRPFAMKRLQTCLNERKLKTLIH